MREYESKLPPTGRPTTPDFKDSILYCAFTGGKVPPRTDKRYKKIMDYLICCLEKMSSGNLRKYSNVCSTFSTK